MISLKALLAFCTIACTYAQVPVSGQCPKVDTIKDFDVKKYLGHWYEQSRLTAAFETGEVCCRAVYTMEDDGHIQIYNYALDKHGQPSNATGDAYIPDKSDASKLKVKFSEFAPYGNYWVVDTDYDTYALVYSCTDIMVVHVELAWVLTRDKTIDPGLKNSLFNKLEDYGIETANFKSEDQTQCPTR